MRTTHTARAAHTTRKATHLMDAMRPSQAFAAPPASSTDDARRWLRLLLLALLSATTLLILPGATAQAEPGDTSTTPGGASAGY